VSPDLVLTVPSKQECRQEQGIDPTAGFSPDDPDLAATRAGRVIIPNERDRSGTGANDTDKDVLRSEVRSAHVGRLKYRPWNSYGLGVAKEKPVEVLPSEIGDFRARIEVG
jgi:hypothetical protein